MLDIWTFRVKNQPYYSIYCIYTLCGFAHALATEANVHVQVHEEVEYMTVCNFLKALNIIISST